jgi:hypothetical protein
MEDRLLNGWKEIGSYLGRAVRTAQRWEAYLDMPIHRPATRKRTAVIAFSREIDNWLVRNRARIDSYELGQPANSSLDLSALREKLARLQMEAAQLAVELRQASQATPRLLDRTTSDRLPNKSVSHPGFSREAVGF